MKKIKMTPAKLRELSDMADGCQYSDTLDDILISMALEGGNEIEIYDADLDKEITDADVQALKKKGFKVTKEVERYPVNYGITTKYVPSKRHKGFFERIDVKPEMEEEVIWRIRW